MFACLAIVLLIGVPLYRLVVSMNEAATQTRERTRVSVPTDIPTAAVLRVYAGRPDPKVRPSLVQPRHKEGTTRDRE